MNNVKPKLVIKEIRGFKDPLPFASTVYNNFGYLSKDPEAQHNMNEILRLFRDENFVGFLVYLGNKIVAYLVGEKKVLNDGRMVFYITYIFVSNKFRGKKIGTQLIGRLINRCKDWGIKFILLTCDVKNEKAYTWYKKIGFQEDPLLNSNIEGRPRTNQVLIYYV